MNERIRKASMDRRALLRNVANVVALRRNVLDMHLGNMNWYPPERWFALEPGYLGRESYIGEYICGVLCH